MGAGVIAYPPTTDLWAADVQRDLSQELAVSEDPYSRHAIAPGHALTRLQIPRLGVNVASEETSLSRVTEPRTASPSTG